MSLCLNYGQKIQEFKSILAELSEYDLKLKGDLKGAEVIPMVKKFLVLRKKVREMKMELDNFPSTYLLGELAACQGDKSKIAEVIKNNSKYIATSKKELKEGILIYNGPLYENFFKKLPESIKNIYTNYPEGRIDLKTIRVGNMNVAALKKAFWRSGGLYYSTSADRLMDNDKYFAAYNSNYTDLVMLDVSDLGFTSAQKLSTIHSRAQMLGLFPVTPETGPQLRLQSPDQPSGEELLMGMNAIDDFTTPLIFTVMNESGQRWLDVADGRPGNFWSLNTRFVFARHPEK